MSVSRPSTSSTALRERSKASWTAAPKSKSIGTSTVGIVISLTPGIRLVSAAKTYSTANITQMARKSAR